MRTKTAITPARKRRDTYRRKMIRNAMSMSGINSYEELSRRSGVSKWTIYNFMHPRSAEDPATLKVDDLMMINGVLDLNIMSFINGG